MHTVCTVSGLGMVVLCRINYVYVMYVAIYCMFMYMYICWHIICLLYK